ncbi:sodium-coupled monocarboxylate transporter 2 [Trichonephila clavipes]|uniref:Sodium-coupled monocarboxylate transporter 2 n=1 Tax=Trichonephila clavipes TaxID=2585209 RepID=A0A8X6S7J9_TRICX|nr:sodium-coupled monocarboxylate transporter 2 [Trichonephila clavipes]
MHLLSSFQVDLFKRYSFWNGLLFGVCYGFGGFGTNQVEVQRLLTLSNVKRAQTTLLISILPVTGLFLSCAVYGVVLYAVYYLCDPVFNTKETGLTKYDQLVPYFLVNKFHAIPGMTGLCIAGIFSGSLSTISSALNSLATVTVMDFIHPFSSSIRQSETKSMFTAKVLCKFSKPYHTYTYLEQFFLTTTNSKQILPSCHSNGSEQLSPISQSAGIMEEVSVHFVETAFSYGFICIGVTFTLLNSSSISQVGYVLNSSLEGPTTAVFAIGVLTRKGFGKKVLFGLLVGCAITCWIGYSSLLSGYQETPLSQNNSMCTSTLNITYDSLSISPACHTINNCSSTVASSIDSESIQSASLKNVQLYAFVRHHAVPNYNIPPPP